MRGIEYGPELGRVPFQVFVEWVQQTNESLAAEKQWRIPTMREIAHLENPECGWYWSSEKFPENETKQMGVNVGAGRRSHFYLGDHLHARPVRGVEETQDSLLGS
jgi:hypothetical protein